MNKTHYKLKSALWLAALVSIFVFGSCDDYMKGKTFLTSDEVMVDEYIEQRDSSMSDFLKVADKAGFRGMLHAYGTNTCFIPTNEALSVYCSRLGIDSLQQLPVDELEKFMKFHIVRDTIQSSEFVDGRLVTATMLGKYLTTRTVQEGGNDPVIRINRQADIVQKDIRVANGIIHKINYVLTPNPKTVGEMIQELPDIYSLFKSVITESGMIDTLIQNKAEGQWFTVFLQSDAAFATAGITDRTSLIEKLKVAQPDFENDEAKLIDIYSKYLIVKRLAYVADLSMSSAELTMATNQVLTFKNSKDSLIVNEYQTLTKFEKGIPVDKNSEWTDLSCYNGVMIDLEGYIQPVKRGPEAIYWQLTDQPEIKKMKEYRKKGSWYVFRPGDLSELQFGGKNNPTITYVVDNAFSEKNQYVNYDYFEIPMRPTVIQWIEIKTPVLTEGVYNVWICWRRGGNNNKFKTTFKQEGKEDQVLPNVFDLGEYFNTDNTPEVNLNNGMKQYNAKQKISVVCSRNSGAIKVEYTGRHTLRFDALSGNSQPAWWDMIQFIPVEQNQLWPRFDIEGNAIYPGTACELIAPTDQVCVGDLLN
ncbi:MAG: fasciclin domain-containing protein [Paludibacteraceae bacterium]|nr:fasciclin domain-containing protein [Paludibacteraceae bacterium]